MLQGVGLAVGAYVGVGHGVALQLQVVVVAEEVLIPLDGLLGLVVALGHNLFGHLAAQAGGADDESLVVFLQLAPVGAGAHVVADGPGARHEFDKVVIALLVLGQDDEVPAALVGLAFLLVHGAVCHVHLAPDDGLEQPGLRLGHLGAAGGYLLFPGPGVVRRGLLQLGDALLQVFYLAARAAVLLVDVVVELFDAEHVAVVGDGNALHAVLHGLVHQAAHAGLPVQQGVLGMYV